MSISSSKETFQMVLPRYLKVLILSSDSWCRVVSVWCKLIKHFSQCHDRLSGQTNLKLWRINQASAAVSISHWPWEHNHQRRGLPGEDAEEFLFGTEMMKIQDYFMEVLIPKGSIESTLQRTWPITASWNRWMKFPNLCGYLMHLKRVQRTFFLIVSKVFIRWISTE